MATVLVVDDVASSREIVGTLLNHHGQAAALLDAVAAAAGRSG